MCDVHLIETLRRRTIYSGLCSYCGEQIDGPAMEVVGTLDNGELGIYRFFYHAGHGYVGCLEMAEDDLDVQEANNGCFSYGTAASIEPECVALTWRGEDG